jgi:CheY-like chemotaxis protein
MPAVSVRTDIVGRVLYVDDNEVNRRLMEAFMSHRPKVTLLLASNGQSGLRMARTHVPDLVLLDLRMPSMDGFAMLAELRADLLLPRMRCVAVSACSMPSEISNAMAAGFDAYVTKPLDLERFLAEVDRWLGAQGR